MTQTPAISLSDGHTIPQVGLGVWRTPDDVAAPVVKTALAAGMKLTVAAVRFRLSELRGDDALRASASAEMAALGVRVPARMTALLIPVGARRAISE